MPGGRCGRICWCSAGSGSAVSSPATPSSWSIRSPTAGGGTKHRSSHSCGRSPATRDHHIDPGAHFSDHPDYQESFPVHCVVGSEGGAFHPDFASAVESGHVDEIVFKGAHSASKSGFEGFTQDGTTLSAWLKARDITDLDVVGIATDHCVKATALDGVRAGFTVRVLLDHTAGVAADTTRAAVDELRRAGVALSGDPVVVA
ncbi:isochorismatase family protein [Streptomyces sp. NPDC059118]|uniref:isochorismatase family protein n=1 Tax=unclassified Streptomyces TaxID=2593676 RepID=UPI00368883ED